MLATLVAVAIDVTIMGLICVVAFASSYLATAGCIKAGEALGVS